MSALRRRDLAGQREALRAVAALQRRRLALEADLLLGLCDPLQQGTRWWEGVRRHPLMALWPLRGWLMPETAARAAEPVKP